MASMEVDWEPVGSAASDAQSLASPIACVERVFRRFNTSASDPSATAGKSASAPAQRSKKALNKMRIKGTETNEPVYSFAMLLKNLNAVAANRVQPTWVTRAAITVVTVMARRAQDRRAPRLVAPLWLCAVSSSAAEGQECQGSG